MARIEGEQHGHAGRVREWLARAVNAPRDPAWTADGVVSDRWAPVSPVTGALDAFRWRVPVEASRRAGGALLAAKVEALVGLGAGAEPALAHAAQPSRRRRFRHETVEPSSDRPGTTPADIDRCPGPQPSASEARRRGSSFRAERGLPVAARVAVAGDGDRRGTTTCASA